LGAGDADAAAGRGLGCGGHCRRRAGVWGCGSSTGRRAGQGKMRAKRRHSGLAPVSQRAVFDTATIECQNNARVRTRIHSRSDAAGAPTDIAEHVADHLVASNLAGHDSHGVIRISWYVEEVRAGWIRPAARPRIVDDRPAAALISGEWGFGHPAATVAVDAACERARRNGLGAAGLVRANHIGRLGTYMERAAERGLVGMMWLGGLSTGRSVVPYGASRGLYGTNPMS